MDVGDHNNRMGVWNPAIHFGRPGHKLGLVVGHRGGAPLGEAATAQEPAGPALRDTAVLGRVDPIAGASDNA